MGRSGRRWAGWAALAGAAVLAAVGAYLVLRDDVPATEELMAASELSASKPTILLLQDLSSLHVPSIPESLADRIRSLDRAAIESLAVLEELRADGHGGLVPVESSDEVVGDSDERLRHREGRLQIGLTPAENRRSLVPHRSAAGAARRPNTLDLLTVCFRSAGGVG